MMQIGSRQAMKMDTGFIVNDHNGFETEFGATDLEDALEIRATKNIRTY